MGKSKSGDNSPERPSQKKISTTPPLMKRWKENGISSVLKLVNR